MLDNEYDYNLKGFKYPEFGEFLVNQAINSDGGINSKTVLKYDGQKPLKFDSFISFEPEFSGEDFDIGFYQDGKRADDHDKSILFDEIKNLTKVEDNVWKFDIYDFSIFIDARN